ncbi:hypothetical protein BDV18DRAFT_142357 [Aspergillus unguis]
MLRSTFKGVRIDEEDEFVCECGHRARDYLVKKKDSPYCGQQFYACRKFISDPTRCGTKIWFDEKEHVRSLIPSALRSPRTPRKQVDIRTFGQYTAPSTSKRKADTQIKSFDSGIGDLECNGPESPSTSRSTKRPRNGYADAETQTSNTEPIQRQSVNSVSHPTAKPMPRRRLFDEFLTAPKSKSAAKFDPFAPRGTDQEANGLGTSIPLGNSFLHTSPTRTQRSVSKSGTVSRLPASSERRPDRRSQGSKDPATPPFSKDNLIGLITPTKTDHAQGPLRETDTSGPQAPPNPQKGRQSQRQVNPTSRDSDDETYDWDDDLDQNILEIVSNVENPSYNPLFL